MFLHIGTPITCRKDSNLTCTTNSNNICYILKKEEHGNITTTRGCLNFGGIGSQDFCNAPWTSSQKVYCCHSDLCNEQEPENFTTSLTCQEDSGSNCTTKGENVCYIRKDLVTLSTGDRARVTKGCLNSGSEDFCARWEPTDKVYCCFTDYCNAQEPANLTLEISPGRDGNISNSTFTIPASPVPMGSPICPLTVSIIALAGGISLCVLSSIMLFITCCCIRKHKQCQPKVGSVTAMHMDASEMNCYLDTVDNSMSSGSGSGLPLLTQRTVAKAIQLEQVIGSGRSGQVYVGVYQCEKVAVKKFSTRDEQSWFRESEVYSKVGLRHENVLVFLASDMVSEDGSTELWLITQYHPHGSLYEFLASHTTDLVTTARMSLSVCRGLTYLHTHLHGFSTKPAIAHRDLKSKNILVKQNRECCIADFGLSVVEGQERFLVTSVQGSKRYMAPEILMGAIDLRRFESLVEADVYAFGLVLWEVCSRCELSKNGEYSLLF